MAQRSDACKAWELLLELLMAERRRLPHVAADFALSEPQCDVLRCLEPGATVPMRQLGEHLDCDASNVTGIIDRLEARGLVERTTCGHDRRVKMVRLTARGRDTRARIMERLAEPPTPIAQLPADDLASLCRILRRTRGT